MIRRPLLLLTLAAAVVVVITIQMIVTVTILRPPTGDRDPGGACLPGTLETQSPQADAASLSSEQREVVVAILSIGKGRKLPPRAWQIALQAGKTESNLRNLPYGDRDSLGIFQMRPSMGWGTAAQLQDIPYQVNKFYDVLLEVPGWETMRPGTAAQRVERSAYPDRYHQWETLAQALIQQYAGITPAAACPTPAAPAGETQKTVLAFAHDQLGEPYVWGAEGPDTWDCSGLVQQAYARAGIALPRTTDLQYRAGTPIPVHHAQPGDLLFWGYGRDPGAVHHVGIALGGKKVLHAPQTGDVVKISTVWDNGELMPQAIRPGPHPKS